MTLFCKKGHRERSDTGNTWASVFGPSILDVSSGGLRGLLRLLQLLLLLFVGWVCPRPESQLRRWEGPGRGRPRAQPHLRSARLKRAEDAAKRSAHRGAARSLPLFTAVLTRVPGPGRPLQAGTLAPGPAPPPKKRSGWLRASLARARVAWTLRLGRQSLAEQHLQSRSSPQQERPPFFRGLCLESQPSAAGSV